MERSRNVEDLHHLRLMALLHELVRERELKGAAEALGLDPRTLSASMDRGALSGLAQVALERWLLAEGDREAARCREEVQALAGRVDGVEERVGELAAQVGQAVEEVQRVAGASAGPHGEDVARDLRLLERRMGPAGVRWAGWGQHAGFRLGGPSRWGQRPGAAPVPRPGDRWSCRGRRGCLRRGLAVGSGVARLVAGPPGPGPRPALAHDGGADSGVGGRHAGGARADPAAGDGAAAGPGAERPAGLAAQGPGPHPEKAGPAPGAALAQAGDHPGAVAEVGPAPVAVRRWDSGRGFMAAPFRHHRSCLRVSDRAGEG